MPPENEPNYGSKRRKVRKGTQSCWECKRRKVRCVLTENICQNCSRRGTVCISQELPDASRLITPSPSEEGALPGANPHNLSSYSTPNSTSNFQDGDLNRTLRSMWPIQHELDQILALPIGLSVLCHSEVCNFYNNPTSQGLPSTRDMLQLPPTGSHPVLIARKLLLLGNYLQGVVLPSDRASQIPESWYQNTMFRVMEAAIKITKNEDLVTSVEGLECIMLEATYQNYAGNLHQAWMAVRRATTIAQLSAFTGQDEPHLDIDPPSDTSPTSVLGESLIFRPSVVNLSDQHPSPSRIIWLWSTYLDNVNLLVRILHIPTVQPLILNMASDPSRPKTKEALLFSIYLAAICSVPQCDQAEAERIMGQPISELIQLYTALAQQALINARFLQTPNFLTLQALTLFLVAQRARLDPQTMWQLTGVAIRSAQQLGYHREKALRSSSVSVFQAELRRRLWWELTLLESFAAKQCGVMSMISFRSLWDTDRPLNINDSALHPEMKDVPQDVTGVTEMSFCSARFEVGELTIAYTSADRALQDSRDVDAAVEDLQKRLENRLLKYCDPSIPMHKLLRLFCRGAITRIKLTVRRHQMFANSGLSLDQRDNTFLLCLQLAEAPNSFARDKAIQKYLWQANAFFPIDAFMFLLGEIAYRTDEQPLPVPLETVWTEIEKAYEYQPRLLYDESNAIYSAIRNLSLKAWEKSIGQNVEQVVPHFIRILRSRLPTTSTSGEVSHTNAQTASTGDETETNTFDGSEFNFDLDTMDSSWSKIAIPNDPEFWEYWQQFAADMPGVSIT
ncbi:hypothetical protein KCU87_g795, partial [Aureobasidium melanogenum]